jgi:hypothetical protein
MPVGTAAHRAGVLDLRPLAWLCILTLALGLALVSLAVLWPPDRERSVVSGQVVAWKGPTTTASLSFRDGRWSGDVDAFPNALCPAPASRQTWCARSPSAEAPLERCSEIRGICWSPTRCPLVVGLNTYYCKLP